MAVLLSERDGPVLRLTLNRPEVRNAFDEEVIAALSAAAREAAADETLRAVVLGGAGKAFCAGADLGWMAKAVAYTREENRRDAEDLARMLSALDALPVPLIGRVHGAALGGGSGLVAVCDIVVAADDTAFGFTEVKLGIIPAVVSPFVIQKIGPGAARELFLTGARFSAKRARRIGLVHAVVPEEELDETIGGFLEELATSAPQALAAAKQLIRDVYGAQATEVSGLTTTRIAEQRVSDEGQEGLRAFLEKRKPRWMA
ncbi:MAG TPA: enoyl-CoA hydratase-related protein [Vicinamibacterales bacterium]|jgi:methylglutaconyl-CoA hydratase|nr:enoyl-CoA hydratase-related protein [Vicinamibacterales bacterium]